LSFSSRLLFSISHESMITYIATVMAPFFFANGRYIYQSNRLQCLGIEPLHSQDVTPAREGCHNYYSLRLEI
jgi:hypothetical protein